MACSGATERTRDLTPEQVLAATWSALVDPRSVVPNPPSDPREIAILVDSAWSDDIAAWRLARRLVNYGHCQKRLAEREAQPMGARVDAGIVWAYWAALELHETLRSRFAV